MKKYILGVPILLLFMATMISAGSAATLTAPDGYSTKSFNTDDVWVYNILESNGNVSGWGNFAGLYLTEVGGSIEIKLLGFYNSTTWAGVIPNVPHFNITFILKNGQSNGTIANISNIDAAYLFTLNFGAFLPGILSTINWTANNLVANAAADLPPFAFSSNGTLNIKDESKIITYNYKQNLTCGNQNTTISYNKETGIIQSWDSEFFGYKLKAELKSSFIPGYPIEIISLVSIGIIAIIIVTDKKRHQ